MAQRNPLTRKTILHVITSLKVGGAEATLYNILENITSNENINKRGGLSDHLVCYFHDGPFVERIRKFGIPVYQVKGVISPYDPVGIYRLAKLVKKVKPDIIHSALWSANIMSRLVARWYKIPLICDLHTNCFHRGWFRNFLEKVTLGFCHRFVAVSPSVARSFLQMFGGNKKVQERMMVIENGIDVDRLLKKAEQKKLSREDLGLGKDDFVIGSVGRLHPIKRYDILIRVFASLVKRCPQASLLLVGGGEEENRLKALAQELVVANRVIFVGYDLEPYKYYPLFDCFVLSSATEGLSIALLEAMAFGLPIVTTNSQVEHDVITNGEEGFVVAAVSSGAATSSGDEKSADEFALLEKCLYEIFSNRNLTFSMSKKSASLVREKYTIDRAVEKYYACYEDLWKKCFK